MNYSFILILFCSVFSTSSFALNTTVEQLLENYRQQGAGSFDGKAGEVLWQQSFKDTKTGKLRNCSNCHTRDLRSSGKHLRTGKPIKPLAVSVNAERLTDMKKVKKWLRRNCKWTLGRECTAQEKGNILIYLQLQ